MAHGSASEVHMNMDVNLHRLQKKIKMKSKFIVPLAVLMEHPGSENKPDITSHECRKKTGITFPTPLQIFNKKGAIEYGNMVLRSRIHRWRLCKFKEDRYWLQMI